MTRYAVILVSTFFAMLSAPPLFADTHTKGPEPRLISFGEEVDLEDYLVTDKITIFDFYSVFCPPCRAMKPYLETLHAKHNDIAVVIVNINRRDKLGIDWDSPVAQEFQLKSIPHLVIYNQDGGVIAEGEEAISKVDEWLKR
jgi:thioredoxin 1